MSRCENGFDSQRECQCDSMCKYYKSCCSDYEAICGGMSKKPLCSRFESTDKMMQGNTLSDITFILLQLVGTRLCLQKMMIMMSCLKAPPHPPDIQHSLVLLSAMSPSPLTSPYQTSVTDHSTIQKPS